MTELLPVRPAIFADEDGVMALCHLLHEENAMHAFKDERVRGALRRAFAKDRAVVGIVERDGVLAGCVYLHVDTNWHSGDDYLLELFNFVHPDHRQAPVAKSLIDWAKRWADGLQLMLMVGILSNKRTEAKIRLYKRQLSPAGAFFIHNAHLASGGAAIAAE